jgi:hypothetical protein
MTIAMSDLADAEPCDVLRGGDGPVYFLFGGRLYVVHEVLGRWIEPDSKPRAQESKPPGDREPGDKARRRKSGPGPEPAQVEHWLVVASVGRFGTPGVFRLQRRPAPPANGPDSWTVRAERR